MKTILVALLVTICVSGTSYAQQLAGLDKSPMDMAYYPHNFAHDRKAGEVAVIRVVYSRPQKNGRDVFGKMVPFGKVWRTGANEATEIKLYKNVVFAGKLVKAGSYSLFTIPGEKEWTVILNSDLDYWGAYSYIEKNDVTRIMATASTLPETVENFTIQFQKTSANGGVMKLAWDKTLVEVPFTVSR